MPRMFDIIKERGKDKKPHKNLSLQRDKDSSVSFPQQIYDSFASQKDSPGSIKASKKLVEAINAKGAESERNAQEKYDYALSVTEVILDKVNKKEPLGTYVSQILTAIDSLTNQLILGDKLLENVARQYSLDEYLPRHITNVSILALALGLEMRLNKSQLHILGTAAIFHDIGLLSLKDAIEQPRQLSDDERRRVKTHALKSAQLISKEGCYSSIIEIIRQHHERINGKGYPLGLGRKNIHTYAQILGLVDTYEAMTHSRSYRKAYLPYQTMREIIGPLKVYFEPDIIKALLDKISIYPIGSFVKLNSEEIAKVVSTNTTSPMRPFVFILLDSVGRPVSEPKIVDLSQSDNLYIKEPYSLPSKE